MSSITIHDIEDTLNDRLSREARRRRTSKNALIKQILAREMGLPVHGTYSDDYREFAGVWSDEERREFETTQRANATVDAGDWE